MFPWYLAGVRQSAPTSFYLMGLPLSWSSSHREQNFWGTFESVGVSGSPVSPASSLGCMSKKTNQNQKNAGNSLLCHSCRSQGPLPSSRHLSGTYSVSFAYTEFLVILSERNRDNCVYCIFLCSQTSLGIKW